MSPSANEGQIKGAEAAHLRSAANADGAIIVRDAGLPSLAMLLNPNRCLAWLAQRAPQLGVSSLVPNYLRYKPGMSCLASFAASGAGTTTFVYFKGYSRESSRKLEKATARCSTEPMRAVFDRDLGVSAYFFPQDAELHGLSRLIDPLARPQSEWRCDLSNDPLSICTLRYKPERRFVGMISAGQKPVAAVKLYTDRDYQQSQRNAKVLTSVSGVKLPRRLGRSRKQRCVVFEWIEGVRLTDLAAEGAIRANVAEEVGAAIAALHAHSCGKLPLAPAHSASNEARIAAVAVAEVLPMLAERAARLAEQIASGLADVDDEPSVCHGDFYLDQIVLDDQIALLDLDNARIGDPAQDLGNFIAHLERDAVSGVIGCNEVDRWRHFLLDGYRRVRRAPSDARISRHAALGLLKLAIEPFRRRQQNWPALMEAIVDRASKMRDAVDCSAPTALQTGPLCSSNQVADSSECPVVILDYALPFAKLATDSREVRGVLSNCLYGSMPGAETVSVAGMRVIRHKPGKRCLIEYDIEEDSTGRKHSLLAKMTRRPVARRVYQIQQSVYAAGFEHGAADGISVPEPLGLVVEWNMWLQRKVAGRPATELLAGPDGHAVVARVAEALYKLHKHGPPSTRIHTVENELAILRERLTMLSDERPQWRRRLALILSQCERSAVALSSSQAAAIHRDFYPDQMIIDGSILYICDLDLYCVGDPSLDVGNFVAHLMELGLREYGDITFFETLSGEFVECYCTLNQSKCRESIEAYTTFSLARLIAIDAMMPSRRAFAEPLLACCEARLL